MDAAIATLPSTARRSGVLEQRTAYATNNHALTGVILRWAHALCHASHVTRLQRPLQPQKAHRLSVPLLLARTNYTKLTAHPDDGFTKRIRTPWLLDIPARQIAFGV